MQISPFIVIHVVIIIIIIIIVTIIIIIITIMTIIFVMLSYHQPASFYLMCRFLIGLDCWVGWRGMGGMCLGTLESSRPSVFGHFEKKDISGIPIFD